MVLELVYFYERDTAEEVKEYCEKHGIEWKETIGLRYEFIVPKDEDRAFCEYIDSLKYAEGIMSKCI